MNTLRRVVLFMGACVAVLSISSCSAQPSGNTERNAALPPFTSQTPAGFDMWEEIDSGMTLFEMTVLSEDFGLEAINVPKREYVDQGAVGVATLEKHCVLIFEQSTLDTAYITVSMLSRYNQSYTLTMPDLTLDSVSDMIDKYRPVCTGDADFPTENVGPTDDTQGA